VTLRKIPKRLIYQALPVSGKVFAFPIGVWIAVRGQVESPQMTLDSFVYFALGCFVGSFTVLGGLVIAGLRSKRRRTRRSSRRRAAANA
jgi:hypothetical protein